MATYFDEVVGKSKYSKTQYDMSLKEEWTKDLIVLIEKLILSGYARPTILTALCSELKFTNANARTLYKKIENKMYKNGADRKNTMLAKNIIRLEHIYNESMKNDNINNAIKAIDCLNKLCGLYTNNVELTQTNFTFQLGSGDNTQQLPQNISVITPIEVIENNEENEVVDGE